jgi:hypothetical protein
MGEESVTAVTPVQGRRKAAGARQKPLALEAVADDSQTAESAFPCTLTKPALGPKIGFSVCLEDNFH